MAHGHFGGMQVACLLWQRVCSEKFPSRTSLSGGFGKEAFLCVPLLLGSKRAVSPKCGHEPFYDSINSWISWLYAARCERANAKLARFLPGWLPRCGNKPSPALDHRPRTFEGLSTNRVHYEVHVMNDLLNRCGGVINHRFCTQRAHKVYIGCPGGPDHLRPLPPGKLDRKRADATSGPQDQDALTCLQPSMVKERLPGCRCSS